MKTDTVAILAGSALNAYALKHLVQRAVDTASVIAFTDANAALAQMRRNRVDLAVISLGPWPEVDGFEVICAILHQRLAFRILAVSEYHDQCTEYFVRGIPIDGFVDAQKEDEK